MQVELHKFYKIPDRIRKKIIMKYRLMEFDPNDVEQTARKERVIAALRDPEVVPYLRGTNTGDDDLQIVEDKADIKDEGLSEIVEVTASAISEISETNQTIHCWKMLLFDAHGRALFAADVRGECVDRGEHVVFVQHGGSPCAIYDGVKVKFLSAEVSGSPNNVELSFITSFAHAGTGKVKLTYLVFRKDGANSVRVDEQTTCGRTDERDSSSLQVDHCI